MPHSFLFHDDSIWLGCDTNFEGELVFIKQALDLLEKVFDSLMEIWPSVGMGAEAGPFVAFAKADIDFDFAKVGISKWSITENHASKSIHLSLHFLLSLQTIIDLSFTSHKVYLEGWKTHVVRFNVICSQG